MGHVIHTLKTRSWNCCAHPRSGGGAVRLRGGNGVRKPLGGQMREDTMKSRLTMKKYLLTSVLLIGAVAAGLALSQPANAVTITVDEDGNGGLPSSLRSDPGPGGLAGVLTYS